MEGDSKWSEERWPELICQPTNYLPIAEGLPGMWMRRALERQGFRVIDSRLAGQVIDVEVVAYDLDEEITWGSKIGVVECHFSDIGSLIAQIANRGLNMS